MDAQPPLPTANVAQAAPDIVRRVPLLRPLYPGCRITGPALTCCCEPGDNFALHRALRQAAPGDVLVCDAHNREDIGHVGELMARDAQNRGVQGIVISGAVRDTEDVRALGFPIFCMGTAPFQATKTGLGAVGDPIMLQMVEVRSGDIVVADDDALLIVPHNTWPGVREKALAIASHEEYIRAEMQTGKLLWDILELQAK